MQSKRFRFQVSLSFPGEHRSRVESVATMLADKLGKEQVLYDEWYRAEFARFNLNIYLPALYHEQSLLLVFFLSSAYADKEWCGLEWRVGLDLLKRKQDDRLMLLRLDRGPIEGVYSIDGYLDISTMPEAKVADEILKRLAIEMDRVASYVQETSASEHAKEAEVIVEWEGQAWPIDAGVAVGLDDAEFKQGSFIDGFTFKFRASLGHHKIIVRLMPTNAWNRSLFKLEFLERKLSRTFEIECPRPGMYRVSLKYGIGGSGFRVSGVSVGGWFGSRS